MAPEPSRTAGRGRACPRGQASQARAASRTLRATTTPASARTKRGQVPPKPNSHRRSWNTASGARAVTWGASTRADGVTAVTAAASAIGMATATAISPGRRAKPPPRRVTGGLPPAPQGVTRGLPPAPRRFSIAPGLARNGARPAMSGSPCVTSPEASVLAGSGPAFSTPLSIVNRHTTPLFRLRSQAAFRPGHPGRRLMTDPVGWAGRCPVGCRLQAGHLVLAGQGTAGLGGQECGYGGGQEGGHGHRDDRQHERAQPPPGPRPVPALSRSLPASGRSPGAGGSWPRARRGGHAARP